MKQKHVDEMRSHVLSYKILQERENHNLDYKSVPLSCNIIVFGPGKSGKSSLIKTFYQALFNTTKIPKEYDANLIIQKLTNKEGTKQFTKFQLKQSKKHTV
mmetsp:Transcript_35434/g.31922  ORF Transcript_35434/g.31922 Transcript_35434/m.31922 type:complete len:101 (+) Transcript_35434:89-391(+)